MRGGEGASKAGGHGGSVSPGRGEFRSQKGGGRRQHRGDEQLGETWRNVATVIWGGAPI